MATPPMVRVTRRDVTILRLIQTTKAPRAVGAKRNRMVDGETMRGGVTRRWKESLFK